ncbi:cysteine-rich motor neuron 1 protein [Drosophila rhopaloa]|uniref:IGFBP N-terminal domain-containing protein n=2 Tax=Drosophila rhopaloa TaxID=1041015 RepID=A0ABM5JFB0_DRORH|nr:cysteine-rich motor neuron 1 protein [Drosophila rhopaloa]
MGGSARGVGWPRGEAEVQDVLRTRTLRGAGKQQQQQLEQQQHNKAKLPHRMRPNGSYFGRLNVSALLIYLWCYLLLIMAASGGSSNVVNGLKCYCNPKECDVIRSPDCPGKGLMLWDPCKCCRICAKTLGESCGGPGGFSGQCEPPLQCVTKLPISSGLGVCMDLQHLTALTYSQHDNCSDSDSIVLQPGCEITNKRCQCWPTMRTCLSELTSDGGSPGDSRWHFKNLEDCQLNLQNLIKLELEFDEDYKISPSKFTYKKLRRKRKSLRKRIIILKD